MKLIRHGLLFIMGMYVLLTLILLMLGCAHFHNVIFLNEACIKPYQGYNYRTCEPLRVTIDGKKFIIPKNFKTDLASIPRLLWPIFAPQYSGFIAPAILHDYLYRCHTNVSRRFADEVLYSSLVTEQITSFTASKFFIAVRIFGGSHFGEHGGECYGYY